MHFVIVIFLLDSKIGASRAVATYPTLKLAPPKVAQRIELALADR
jgi:hypothetical protein